MRETLASRRGRFGINERFRFVGNNSIGEGSYDLQLVLQELVLPPGGECSLPVAGWLVVHALAGSGYWLEQGANLDLPTEAVLLAHNPEQGCLRASQLGELRIQYFRAVPTALTGLVTMADQAGLEKAASDETTRRRVVIPGALLAERLTRLGAVKPRNGLPMRVELLAIFLELLGRSFAPPALEPTPAADANARLRQLLDQFPADRLAEISFAELVRKTGCSPRHVSRVFAEIIGVSFREKQLSLRLNRACELLATTDSKLADVAQQSGYPSPSLFNLVFRKRLGVSPAKWRQQKQKRHGRKPVVRRAAPVPRRPLVG